MTLTATAQPKIYVACLAAYTNGKLYGAWINADQDAEDIEAEVKEMLKQSPEPNAEEWAIHSFEGFHDLRINEHESLEKVAELAQAIAEHGEAFAAYASHMGVDDATDESFQDKYRGKYSSEEDFAEEYYKESYTIPEHLDSYIDWERVATDLFIDSFFSIECNGGVYVFSN